MERRQYYVSEMTCRWLAPMLAVVLMFPPGAWAQQAAGDKSLPMTQSLKIVALAGQHESNDLEHHVMAPLVVQVLDQNDRPVEGAEVTFRFPLNGPSARFPGEKNVLTVRTNADGQASALGWTANAQTGTFIVQVSATRGQEMGTGSLTMTNSAHVVADARPKHKKWWSTKTGRIVLVAAAAAAVTVAVVLATRSGKSSSTTVIATPGSPTIGGPQ